MDTNLWPPYYLQMVAAGLSQTLAPIHKDAQCHIPKDQIHVTLQSIVIKS
jgi:hypothetical protein